MSQHNTSSTPISSFNISISQSQQSNHLIVPPSAAPPFQAPNDHNSTINNSRNYAHFVRRLVLAIVLLFVTINAVHFIAWSILHPLPPVFEVNSFQINQVPNVSGPNSPAPPETFIVFAIGNPNKKLSLLLDDFEILVLQGKTRVSVSSSERKPMNESVYLSTKNPIKYFGVHERLNINLWKKREVKFNVKVNLRTKFLAWNWFSKREHMQVDCKDLSVRSLSEKKKAKCSIRAV